MGCGGPSPFASPAPPPQLALDRDPVDVPGIERLMRLSDRILSGGMPTRPEAFRTLAELGVRVVVSVDGQTPDVAAAEAAGLRYVHIPIGYDGVPEAARLAIVRVMREADAQGQRVFFHCHHGRHRGPAAAAVALAAETGCPATEAVEVLRRAETAPGYKGLWRDVAAFASSPPPPGTPLPELRPTVPLRPLTAAMVEIDRRHDRLKGLRGSGPVPPAEGEALQLAELLRESARLHTAGRPSGFAAMMTASADRASEVAVALAADRAWTDRATGAMASLAKSCTACHTRFRD
jgi:protein tyrosine phosphatase (PTP) superfamily phosphohydrolase (DUF442 family)